MTASDDQLVSAALAGDLEAFARLVERHRDVVLRLAARIVGDDDAEDVAQDAFLRAYHRLGRWRGEGPFPGWLLPIAHNSAIDAPNRPRAPPLPPDESVPEGPHAARRTPLPPP